MKPISRPFPQSNSGFLRMEPVSAPPTLTTKPPAPNNSRPATKLLTAAEMSARREKGLCKQRIVYMIMTKEEEMLFSLEVIDVDPTQPFTEDSPEVEEVHMSLHVMMGEGGLTTMRVIREVGNHQLNILLDTGSTLSFLQEDTARKLGCVLHSDKPLMVRVGNG